MKSKQLLRFYFSADSLNRALDNVITANACKSANFEYDCEYYAERICTLIREKQKLGELWRYLDGVMNTLPENEKDILRFYGAMRTGVSRLDEGSRKEVKRVTVKFTRHARLISRHDDGVKLVKKYYCLIKGGSSAV